MLVCISLTKLLPISRFEISFKIADFEYVLV